ncbi:MAG: PASTA domain-containing protein [Actinomycetota bacterium]|nr:PASTA domain-containing protein [Actinomycetota bacterium]
MPVSETPALAIAAGVKRRIIRLVDPPPPVDGVVVSQDPAPGKRVARGSVVTLRVLHED